MTTPLSADITVPFTPPALANRKPKIIFELRVPTFEMKDEIGIRLYELNAAEVDTSSLRAHIIDELYKQNSEQEADTLAGFLEGYWQNDLIDNEALAAWQEQEIQRLLDIAEGADPEPEQQPKPVRICTARDDARAIIITNGVKNRSEVIRKLLAGQQRHKLRFAWLIAQIQIAGWSGLKFKPEWGEGEFSDMLAKPSIEKIRGAIGETAWQQLARECELQFELDASAEKNSDSPPWNSGTANGSADRSGGSDDSDGSSTRSNTGPAPSDVSAKTTATSSGSSPVSTGAKKKHGRTAAG